MLNARKGGDVMPSTHYRLLEAPPKQVKLLEGHPAEDLARLCFSKLRFLPISLKDSLRREGLWEDLSQDLYRTALEGWRQGKTAREMGGMATRELRAFLSAYGYRRYRQNHHECCVKQEALLPPEAWDDLPLAKVEPVPTPPGLESTILALLGKHPEGLSQCQVNQACKGRLKAAVVSGKCVQLVLRGVIREKARPKGNGRHPSPLLVLRVSPEARIKMSRAKKGKPASEKSLRNLALGRTMRWTPERRMAASGEGNRRAVLTKEQVGEIRSGYAQGLSTQQELAEIYGVKQVTISAIITEKTWKQTHCKRGHLFDEANTRVDGKGHRTCRICHNEATRRYIDRNKRYYAAKANEYYWKNLEENRAKAREYQRERRKGKQKLL